MTLFLAVSSATGTLQSEAAASSRRSRASAPASWRSYRPSFTDDAAFVRIRR